MNPVDHVKQHAQTLGAVDQPVWLPVGMPLGLSAFEAKAYYTIGLMREMIATAGLARSRSLHLGAIFQVLDAIELLGRAVGGFRHAREAGKRLQKGLKYVLDLNVQDSTPLVVRSAAEYADLRNFTGHGAASVDGPLNFDPWTALGLLHLTTRALDAMWTDSAAMGQFVNCQIDPLVTAVGGGKPEVIYVRDVQAHLGDGKLPSEGIPFDAWRSENTQVVISTASPLVTGILPSSLSGGRTVIPTTKKRVSPIHTSSMKTTSPGLVSDRTFIILVQKNAPSV